MSGTNTIDEIVRAHHAGDAHADIARRLGVSRQYVGSVAHARRLKPRSKTLAEARTRAAVERAKGVAQAKIDRAKPHLTPMAQRLSKLWVNRDYSVEDIARELSTTSGCVMKAASVYRHHFPDLFPRRVGGRKKASVPAPVPGHAN